MSLETDAMQQGKGKPNGDRKDPVERFKALVEEGERKEALRVYREEYNIEEQVRVKTEALTYFKSARISGF